MPHGLSVRELKRAAAALDVTEPVAAFWIELAYAAGLLASDGETDERYAPTPASDEWLDLPAQDRWAHLATAWLAATRTPGLIGGQDAKGRALSTLGPDLDRSAAPEVRRRVLALFASLPPGTAPDPQTLLARLRWERPLRASAAGGPTPPGDASDLRSRIALWTVNDAELLGITGRGALSSQARALLDEGPEAAAARLAPLIPEPLDHVLLQADLTAVAPGPLERPLADMLSVLADVESKGGATVYRFTPGSVRRALDAGRAATDLHAFLATHSRTPVPQPLSYLIDDVARRHGHLRIGAASAYVRCDDEAVLNEILADKRSATLRLRRLAPTVLAAQADPGSLLEGLREMGYAPAAESAEGDVLITRAGCPPHSAPYASHAGPRGPAGPGRHAADGGGPGHPGRLTPPRGPCTGSPRTRAPPRRAPSPDDRRRDPCHGAGGGDDRLGRLDRLRQRGRRGQPAGDRPGQGGGRLRDGVRPHGRRGQDVSAAPDHGRRGARRRPGDLTRSARFRGVTRVRGPGPARRSPCRWRPSSTRRTACPRSAPDCRCGPWT